MADTREFRDGNDDGGIGEVVYVIGWVDGTWCLELGSSVRCGFRDMNLALDGEMRVLVYEEWGDGGV